MKIGFMGLLALIFITCKLVGAITWSWWWVTAPLWGSFALTLVVGFFALIFAGFLKPNRF